MGSSSWTCLPPSCRGVFRLRNSLKFGVVPLAWQSELSYVADTPSSVSFTSAVLQKSTIRVTSYRKQRHFFLYFLSYLTTTKACAHKCLFNTYTSQPCIIHVKSTLRSILIPVVLVAGSLINVLYLRKICNYFEVGPPEL